MFPASLDCPFVIAPLLFSNVYTQTSLTLEVNSDAPERYVVPAQLVTPVVLRLNDANIKCYINRVFTSVYVISKVRSEVTFDSAG
jgi:hypothetical protein